MSTPQVLLTCPPMLGMIEEFRPLFARRGVALTPAKVAQTLSEDELCALLPGFDGWIIGDDPATRRVFSRGSCAATNARSGRPPAMYGMGRTESVDFDIDIDIDDAERWQTVEAMSMYLLSNR